MCLKKRSGRLVAERNIVCYKVLHVLNGTMKSPLWGDVSWTVGDVVVDCAKEDDGDGFVGGGFIHSFKSASDAVSYAETLRFEDVVVYLAVIPAGCAYYKGVVEDGVLGYASKSLRLVRKIKYLGRLYGEG